MRFSSKDGGHSRITLSSTGWLVLTFSLLYFIAFRYYHHVSSRDPTSYFFDPGHAYQRKYSTVRIAEAEALIKAAKDTTPQASPKEPPFICIGIATVARRDTQYVHLTVGSVLAGLNSEERKDIYLTLLFGHTDPSKHPMASEPWVRTLPNKLLEYDSQDSDFVQIKAWEEGGWYRNKSIYDYTYLLKDCHRTGAKYTAIFEDDTIAVADWFAKTKAALHDVEDAMEGKTSGQRWVYLRLFYSDDLLGWNSEEWPRYLFWSVVVWSLVTGCLLWLKSQFRRTIDLRLTNTSVVVLSTIGVMLSVTLHFMAGRLTNHPMRPGIHEMNKYGCCSQGLVFPQAIIPDLLDRTDLTTDWLVDMMIEKIANQQGWLRWATVPALLQHIGTTSSKGYGFDGNAKKLWSFGFEEWRSTPRL